MELYQLEYFRILCKYRNFTSASEELGVTQPAVSTAVKKLEEEYDVELIDRDSKAFLLTQVGEMVLRRAITIHNEVTSMREELNANFSKKREVVRLAIPFTMCPGLLPELLSNYAVQNKAISLILQQKGHAAIAQGLVNRSIDIGVFSKDLVNPLLEQREYTRIEFYAAFSPEHRFNECETVTPDMLKEETLIFAKASKTIPGYIQKYLEDNGITPSKLFHDGFSDGNVHIAQRGQGIALAPRHIAGEHRAPLSPPLYCDLVVAWNGKNSLTKEQQDLIDFLIDNASVLKPDEPCES